MRKMLGMLAALLSLFLSMCSLSSVSGTGSGGEARTAQVTGTALYAGGEPAVGARVVLRPELYLSGITEYRHENHETRTDSCGRFIIPSVDTGNYCCEVNDGDARAVLVRFRRNAVDTLIALGADTLRMTGAIRGKIASSMTTPEKEYVLVEGIEGAIEQPSDSGGFIIEDVPQGSYSVVVIPLVLGYAPEKIDDVPVTSGMEYDMGTVQLVPFETKAYSKKIVLNTSTTGADVPETVRNFPVLVRLNETNFSFDQAMGGGEDIRFAGSDSTLLPFEIERWDPAAGLAEVWVRLDTLYGNDSTQHILMFWGGSNGDTLSVRASGELFDTTAGFKGVWHLGAYENGLLPDATRYRYHGTPYNMEGSLAPGAIGFGRKFSGETGYCMMEGTAAGALDFPANGTYSISAWVNPDILNGRYRIIASKGNKQYNLQLKNNDNWEFTEFRDTPSDSVGWEETLASAEAGKWVYLVGIRSGTRQYLYVNGACVDSTITLFPLKDEDTQRRRDQTRNFAIGRLPDGPSYYFSGIIDEVRVSGNEPTSDYIKLCYMNQRADDKLVVLK
ncbi:MAG: DUF2341 domain-containing protein [Chitinispirillaceae bacterium]|nr:DUF2341 domain-containing protein [Chitinispirillaceae bacterium]